MIDDYFIDITIKYLNQKIELSLPRFTEIDKLKKIIIRESKIDFLEDFSLYCWDWHRFLTFHDNLDNQFVVNGCVLEIIALEN
jgi:uncharacterized ubiquitin-like protein YukD